jgi:hypothetical protein
LNSSGACLTAPKVAPELDPVSCIDGLILDTAGACVNPPVSPHICPNGYYSDGEGNCF